MHEVAIHKLCSLFGIGPKVMLRLPDIIQFKSCFEFYMEKYERVTEDITVSNEEFKQMQLDLLRKLKKMHELHIVHRDIKPRNILFR